MNQENLILGLVQLKNKLNSFLTKNKEEYNEFDKDLDTLMTISHHDNPWFTLESQKLAIKNWVFALEERAIRKWLSGYKTTSSPKKIGLILAGNIPMVGWHDVISVVLSLHIPIIKLSSKDHYMIPFLLEKWSECTHGNIIYETVDRLVDYDAVIATGSNNTAKILEYYFKNKPSIIRKNRTSIAVLSGEETPEELEKLADDIFTFYGLGCRNVSKIYLPQDFLIDRLFESFTKYKDVIHHHKYANNYEYNRAVYLLNSDVFWDNNFVMMREEKSLFTPLSVINFERYDALSSVKEGLQLEKENIQCIVTNSNLDYENRVSFGESQCPTIATYADNVDTLAFLENLG